MAALLCVRPVLRAIARSFNHTANRRHDDAERALGLYEPGKDPPEDVARASFVLARALEGEPAEVARARTLAEQALEGFSGKDRTAVEEWLRQHPPPGDAPASAEGP